MDVTVRYSRFEENTLPSAAQIITHPTYAMHTQILSYAYHLSGCVKFSETVIQEVKLLANNLAAMRGPT